MAKLKKAKKNFPIKAKPLIGIALGLLLFVFAGIWWTNHKATTNLEEGWMGGDWKVTYFYENKKLDLYEGELYLQFKDTLSGQLQINFPARNIMINIKLLDLQLSKDAKKISGYLLNDQSKLRGGYPTEAFEWELKNLQEFEGTAKCFEYCAEGTEEVTIFWKGIKKESI